ncbi:MAG: cobalamin biosynthesis protein CobQ [Candidatus Levybacteria bacterium]|nr:cobalamin biosynthesis protein CobQ [Candidatus Levybacteria bacterium]
MTKSQKPKAISYKLTIGWLYPDLMSTYGDRGNIIVLQKRAEWRGIKVKVKPIGIETSPYSLVVSDLLFMGGAQDTQQEIVNRDLQDMKGKVLIEQIEKGIPGLYICGAYQFLGKYYRTADKKKLPGLGVFPLSTENPGEKYPRLIGNIVIEPKIEGLTQPLVGFENHGGRTYLDYKNQRLGDVKKGFGNNGKDESEGIVYKNSFGTYLHGPILPKNPQLADLLLTLALEKKYGEKIRLEPLDNSIEKKARETVMKKLI